MIQLILGGIALSIVHALIPNHWIPIVTLSRAEKWKKFFTLRVTALAGTAHVSSTIVIGILIGFLGYKLGSFYRTVSSVYAPLVLILFGIIYIYLNFKGGHHHHHEGEHFDEGIIDRKSTKSVVFTLVTTMFFSPCVELEAYYFSAGTGGWLPIITLSMIYLVVTVSMMVILVNIGIKSLDMLKSRFHFMEHYEKFIAGGILLLLGILAIFVEL